MSYDGVRCAECNAIDADEWPDGTASCANCGADLCLDAPAPNSDGLTVYPVLVWSWAPCQTCGSTHGVQGGPEDDHCWECGAGLMPIKRRLVVDGFPINASAGSASPEGVQRGIVVGDRGVCGGAGGVRLTGGGPFTLLEVTAVRATGELDVAAVQDGTVWVGVPPDSFLLVE
jgi:hypothetical protein